MFRDDDLRNDIARLCKASDPPPPDPEAATRRIDALCTMLSEVTGALEAALSARVRTGRGAGEPNERITRLEGLKAGVESRLADAVIGWVLAGGAVKLLGPQASAADVEPPVAPAADIGEPPENPPEEPDPGAVAETEEQPAPPPEAAAVEEPVVPRPVLSSQELRDALQKMRAGNEAPRDRRRNNGVGSEAVRRVVTELGAPGAALSDSQSAETLIEKIEGFIDAQIEYWPGLDRETRTAIVRYLTTLTRSAEAALGAESSAATRIRGALTQLSREAPIYYVNGLQRRHEPMAARWSSDAETAWSELIALAPGVTKLLRASAPKPADQVAAVRAAVTAALDDSSPERFKEIERSIAEALRAGLAASDEALCKALVPVLETWPVREEPAEVTEVLIEAMSFAQDREEEAEPQSGDEAPDWACAELLAGKRAVMVGGAPRRDAEERLRRALGLSELTWERMEPRRRDAIGEAAMAGNIDYLVLLARFMSHAAWEPLASACRESPTRLVLVERGYGVSQVRRAFERVLSEEKASV